MNIDDCRDSARGLDSFWRDTKCASEVEVLTESGQALESMLSAVGLARHRVWVEMYILEDDALGRHFERALVGSAATGADVRVLCDGYGSRHGRWSILSRLRRSGVRVAVSRPLWREFPDRRNHRKIVIADRQAYVGGVNIANRYLHHWRDVCLRVQGRSVAEFERVFAEDWMRASGQRCERGEGSAPRGDVRVVAESVESAVVECVGGARRCVLLSTPYFVPPPEVERALTERVTQGVEVAVLIPDVCDSRVVGAVAEEYIARVVARGVRVWRYTAGFNHAKTLVTDDVAMVGSANFDYRSLRRNREIMTLFGGRAAEYLERDFRHALSRSVEVRRSHPSRQGALDRLIRLLATPLHPLL